MCDICSNVYKNWYLRSDLNALQLPVMWYTELNPIPNRPTFKGSSLFLLLAIS